ncbi:MAG: aminopeptidase N [Hyphomicrobiales bacterium]
MRADQTPTIRLKDYTAPDWRIESVHLDITLDDNRTRVVARSVFTPASNVVKPLVLDGDELVLESIALDETLLSQNDFKIDASTLTIPSPPARRFTLTVTTRLDPAANTKLMGLYRSSGNYCTQCEAEGFRRITYFLDRPDIMSVYTTRITAKKSEAPILLGNGNKIEEGDLKEGWHYAVWHDPHPKPSYLFALVGGQLGKVGGQFVTQSGRKVDLGIYVEVGKENRAAYALDALIRSMKWDEAVFGCEYDLDVFNIVAVSDFNMGAMENKGLNIFNDKYVLASPESATDTDYLNIEAIIAHEYFHNWTGNRITCRDWFQLCLKEGLTVFRDQEFTSDQRSRAVKRIADVRNLRAQQFVEDGGPLAHPVRPHEYREINNFYTPTVYEKGAELIRMLKCLIGPNHFKKGMDLYLSRCDGMAATVEDFIACFEEVNGQSLAHFSKWYQQAGTPHVTIHEIFEEQTGRWTIKFSQSTAPTPGQPTKDPVVIPIALGFLDKEGQDLKLSPRDGGLSHDVYVLKDREGQLVFDGLKTKPILSAFRAFSAPVIVHQNTSESENLIRLAHDSDSFNRWQAAQNIASTILKTDVEDLRSGKSFKPHLSFAEALQAVLRGQDHAFIAQILAIPSESDIAREIGKDIDPDAIRDARLALRKSLGEALSNSLQSLIASLSTKDSYTPDAKSAGRRALRLIALDLLSRGRPDIGLPISERLYHDADNMTDRFGALSILAQHRGPTRERALDDFAQRFEMDPLILDKWFSLQASIPEHETLDRVKNLMSHPGFSKSNPNRLRALVDSFAMANPSQFHRADGAGHEFVADIVIETDRSNPQVAARLLGAFKSWRSLESKRRAYAKKALEHIAAQENLSSDVADIVTRSLADES